MRVLILFFVFLAFAACTSDKQDGLRPISLEGICSQRPDYHPCNFKLKDQNDKEVSLYSFYGEITVLDISAMWCGPCVMAAGDVQEIADKYGINYLTLLIEDTQGNEPDLEDVQAWSENNKINEPVLQGSPDMISSWPDAGWPLYALPTFYFMDEELVIQVVQSGYNKSVIESYIETIRGQKIYMQ